MSLTIFETCVASPWLHSALLLFSASLCSERFVVSQDRLITQKLVRGRVVERPEFHWAVLDMWQTRRVVGCKGSGNVRLPLHCQGLKRRHLLKRGCTCEPRSQKKKSTRQRVHSRGPYVSALSATARVLFIRESRVQSVKTSLKEPPSRFQRLGLQVHRQRPERACTAVLCFL